MGQIMTQKGCVDANVHNEMRRGIQNGAQREQKKQGESRESMYEM